MDRLMSIVNANPRKRGHWYWDKVFLVLVLAYSLKNQSKVLQYSSSMPLSAINALTSYYLG